MHQKRNLHRLFVCDFTVTLLVAYDPGVTPQALPVPEPSLQNITLDISQNFHGRIDLNGAGPFYRTKDRRLEFNYSSFW